MKNEKDINQESLEYKLLPCPFCGFDTAYQDSSSGAHEVLCGNCTAYTWGPSPEEAIAQWNTRPK